MKRAGKNLRAGERNAQIVRRRRVRGEGALTCAYLTNTDFEERYPEEDDARALPPGAGSNFGASIITRFDLTHRWASFHPASRLSGRRERRPLDPDCSLVRWVIDRATLRFSSSEPNVA
jgi:hypothetical protein